MSGSYAHWMLDQEARALMDRLSRVKPFVLAEPMLLAASLLPAAQIAIERFLAKGRHELRERIAEFLFWLHGHGRQVSAQELQRRFVFLRLRFNSVLSQLDLFNQVITQRSENELGVWLSGLDVAAADALAMPRYYEAPPVICYLDRGMGAAIRRARTRLPGGGENPVAIIRVPRERMIGSGVASSLFHEVGHQGAALLGLVPSLRLALQAKQKEAHDPFVWRLWERWISEVISDFWSIARAGVVPTLGADRRRQSAARLRLSPQFRRSASCSVDSRQIELRDRRQPLSAPAVAKGRGSLGLLLPDRRSRRRTPRIVWAAGKQLSGIHLGVDQSRCTKLGRPLAAGSNGSRATQPGTAHKFVRGLAQRAAAALSRASLTRPRSPRPSQSKWRFESRRRKRTAGETAQLLGDAQHFGRIGLLRLIAQDEDQRSTVDIGG